MLVHIDGAPDAILQQDASGSGQWTTVCAGACDAHLPIGPMYRVDGNGMRRSSQFQLRPSPGNRITLDVSPASSTRFAVGVALVPIGALTMGAGALVVFAAGNGATRGSEALGEPGPADYTLGHVLMIVGAVTILAGLILFVHDWETGVRQGNVENVEPPSTLRPATELPTGGWRERSPEERALPTATVVPLGVLRF